MRAVRSSKPSTSKVSRAAWVSTGQPCATRLVVRPPRFIMITEVPSTLRMAIRFARKEASEIPFAERSASRMVQRARIVRRDI